MSLLPCWKEYEIVKCSKTKCQLNFKLNSFLHFLFAGEANENFDHTRGETDSGLDTNKTLEILQDVNTKLYIGTEVSIYQSRSVLLKKDWTQRF